MADYYTPWGEASGGFDRLGQAAQNVMLGLAQRRAGMARAGYEFEIDKRRLDLEREQNRERGALYRAQTALAQADEAVKRKEAATAQAGLDLADSFGGTIENLVKAQQGQTPLYAPALESVAAGQAARLAAMGNQHAPVNLSQMSVYNDPRLRALMATGTRLPTEIGINQMPLDYASGLPLQAGMINQAPGYKATDLATGNTIENPEAPFDPARTLGSTLGPIVSLLNGVRNTNAKAMAEESPIDPQSQALEELLTSFVTKAARKAESGLGEATPSEAPEQKVKRANGLAQQVRAKNPTWTDAQIKAEVLKQMK